MQLLARAKTNEKTLMTVAPFYFATRKLNMIVVSRPEKSEGD